MLKKKASIPGTPIGDKKEQRWVVILALGKNADNASKMAFKDGDTRTKIELKNDKNLSSSEDMIKAVSNLAGDLLESIEKFIANEKDASVPMFVDIHVCGPQNACVLIGMFVEKIRHQTFNDYDRMISVGNVTAYDRSVGGEISIDYGEV